MQLIATGVQLDAIRFDGMTLLTSSDPAQLDVLSAVIEELLARNNAAARATARR